MIKWIKRIIALLFVLSISLVVILGVTFLAIYSKGHNNMKTERWKLSNNHRIGFIPDEKMMYRARPNVTYQWYDYTHNLADTSKTISIDSLGRRLTPWSAQKHKHTLFFGCSYIYGDGLSDEHSIPYKFGEIDTIYNAYNYGLSGYGTSHMLEILKTDISNEIPEKEGLGLYFLIDHHRDRITNDPYTMIWGYDFPNYGLDDNLNLLDKGTFYESNKVGAKFWKGFGDWSLWKPIIMFQNYKKKKKEKQDLNTTHSNNSSLSYQFANDITLNGPHDHKYLLMSKVIKASEELYLRQFPKGEFYVVIFPGENTNVLRFLEYSNLKIIDLSKAIDLNEIGGRQRDGYHPNEIGAEAIANLLQKRLDQIPIVY